MYLAPYIDGIEIKNINDITWWNVYSEIFTEQWDKGFDPIFLFLILCIISTYTKGNLSDTKVLILKLVDDIENYHFM